MSSNMMAEDLRSIKTERALYIAMLSLLKQLSFRKITVKGICEEALISRAAFYAHFIDKYDLLEYWMKGFWLKYIHDNETYEQKERALNSFILENKRIIQNLMDDADSETLTVLFNVILSTNGLTLDKKDNAERYQKNVVLSNFYAGGIISYLSWLIKNKFPSDVPPMNKYLFEMLDEFRNRQK